MLNELAHLAASLTHCGIQLPPSHPNVQQPARTEALWVRLGDGARIQTVEHLSADRMTQLWTIREGNHNSFPFVRVQQPLTDVGKSSPFRKELNEAGPHDIRGKAEVLRRCLVHAGRTKPAKFDTLWLSLRKRATKLLEMQWASPELAAWRVLLDIVARSEMVGRDWFEQLASESVAASLNGGLLCIGLVEALVVGKAASGKADKLSAGASLFFDIADPHRYGRHPVAHPDLARYIAAALDSPGADTERPGTCALSGESVPLERTRFPAPNLPGIGKTYLLSMNKDAPCQTRYGLTGTHVLPVGRTLVADIENALKWITDQTRDGRTWRAVPGVGPGERDLLLAYLERLPSFDAELAAIFSFGGEDGSRGAGEASFEAACENVLASLKASQTVTLSDAVCLIVLRKVDKGRAQVVLSREIMVAALTDAVSEWRTRCSQNLPKSGTWLPGKKGEKGRWIGPPVLFPDEAVRLLGKQWQREGTESAGVQSCRLQEAFDLFLPPPEGSPVAGRLLALQLQRAWPLLAGFGHGDGRRADRHPKGLDLKGRVVALKHLSLMGTLLYRLDRKKEIYMNEGAFKLGELLALADGLHGDYCRIRRKGGYPPQLIGNALLPAAANAPARALARLAERLRIYQAWAATGQGAEMALARWRLGRFGEVSRSLHNLGIPERLDDAGRAELLLGYLARQGKSGKQEPNSAAQEHSGGGDDV